MKAKVAAALPALTPKQRTVQARQEIEAAVAANFTELTRAQQADMVKLIEKTLDADEPTDESLDARIRHYIDVTYQWQLDTTTSDAISGQAERWRAQALKYLKRPTPAAAFDLGAQWQVFELDAGPIARSVEFHRKKIADMDAGRKKRHSSGEQSATKLRDIKITQFFIGEFRRGLNPMATETLIDRADAKFDEPGRGRKGKLLAAARKEWKAENPARKTPAR